MKINKINFFLRYRFRSRYCFLLRKFYENVRTTVIYLALLPQIVVRYRKLENFSKLKVQNVKTIYYLDFTLLITMNQHLINEYIYQID
jgi:hypothetical protein